MKQSRLMSLVEAIANVIVGYGIAVLTQLVVFPWFGLLAQISAGKRGPIPAVDGVAWQLIDLAARGGPRISIVPPAETGREHPGDRQLAPAGPVSAPAT